MRRRDTPFLHNSPLLPLHPCDVTKPVQQLPEPATLPWREITEMWLIRVAVALAAILELEYCSRSVLDTGQRHEELRLHTGHCGWQLKEFILSILLFSKEEERKILLVYLEGTKHFQKLHPINTYLQLHKLNFQKYTKALSSTT